MSLMATMMVQLATIALLAWGVAVWVLRRAGMSVFLPQRYASWWPMEASLRQERTP